jgi:hypothetical protein
MIMKSATRILNILVADFSPPIAFKYFTSKPASYIVGFLAVRGQKVSQITVV